MHIDQSNQLRRGGRNNSSNVGNIDIGSIMSGNGSTDTIYGQLDEASKQQIISDLAKDGYEASFGADGSMTIGAGKDSGCVYQEL